MPICKIKGEDGKWLDLLAIKGEQGIQGEQGPPGPIGVQGPQGIQGPPGKTPKKHVDYFTEQDLKELDRTYIHKYISLLSISETAPVSFSLGDKYLNTIDSCIYTAIDESHWSDFSEEVNENYFYIDESSGELYYFHNNKLKKLYINIINALKELESLKYDLIAGNYPVKTGRKVDGKDEWAIRIDLNFLPNTSSKDITLHINLNNILFTEMPLITPQSDINELMTFPYKEFSYFFNDNTLHIDSTNDKSRFHGYMNIYFIYKQEDGD